jgi:hypothetical protein
MSAEARGRTLDLLADRAVQPLEGGEQAELRQLLAQFPELDDDLMDLSAAAVHLSAGVADQPLPASLETALLHQAAAFEAGSRAGGRRGPSAKVVPLVRPERSVPHRSQVAWWLAAAAVVLAVAGWWGRLLDAPPSAFESPTQVAATPATPGPESLATLPASLQKPWSTTEDPAAAGVSGEIVWNTEEQTGFMRFKGLPANDPSEYQYQLWIFDAQQDERYPIDGGVFNIPPNDGEAIVPIDPKLEVKNPTLFAITIEKPGGVVVSGRERLVVLAPVA